MNIKQNSSVSGYFEPPNIWNALSKWDDFLDLHKQKNTVASELNYDKIQLLFKLFNNELFEIKTAPIGKFDGNFVI